MKESSSLENKIKTGETSVNNLSRVEAGENKPDFGKMAVEAFCILNEDGTLYKGHQPYPLQKGCEYGMEKIWNSYVLPLSSELNTLREKLKVKESFSKVIEEKNSELETLREESKRLKNDLKSQEESFCSMTSGKTAFEFWKKLKTELEQVKKQVKKANELIDALHKYDEDTYNYAQTMVVVHLWKEYKSLLIINPLKEMKNDTP